MTDTAGNSVTNPLNTISIIDSSSIKIEISNIDPSSNSETVYFKCEDLNNLGVFVVNFVTINIFAVSETTITPTTYQVKQRDFLEIPKSVFTLNSVNCDDLILTPFVVMLNDEESTDLQASETSTHYFFNHTDIDYIGSYLFKIALRRSSS